MDGVLWRSNTAVATKNIESLARGGFGALVAVTPEYRPPPYAQRARELGMEFSHLFFWWTKFPPGEREFAKFFRIVAENELKGKKVLVHCGGGLLNSGIFSSAYLMAKGKPTKAEDYDFLIKVPKRRLSELYRSAESMVKARGSALMIKSRRAKRIPIKGVRRTMQKGRHGS